MQFNFKIPTIFDINKDTGIIILNGISLGKTIKQIKPEHSKNIAEIINKMGHASAYAQNLKQIITTFERFIGSDNRLYIKVEDNKVLGMLKVGQKNLFYRDYIGNIKEMKPTCVLDFYVHESCQRNGIGKELFMTFLSSEKKSPDKLAYDRPSDKLLGFLRKHFGLSKFIPQNNNYVIFNAYFDSSMKQLIVKDSKEFLKKDSRNKQLVKQKQPSKNSFNNTIDFCAVKSNPVQNTKAVKCEVNNFRNTTINRGYQIVSPWALSETGLSSNSQFRTTSNSYGDHYHYRKK